MLCAPVKALVFPQIKNIWYKKYFSKKRKKSGEGKRKGQEKSFFLKKLVRYRNMYDVNDCVDPSTVLLF